MYVQWLPSKAKLLFHFEYTLTLFIKYLTKWGRKLCRNTNSPNSVISDMLSLMQYKAKKKKFKYIFFSLLYYKETISLGNKDVFNFKNEMFSLSFCLESRELEWDPKLYFEIKSLQFTLILKSVKVYHTATMTKVILSAQ